MKSRLALLLSLAAAPALAHHGVAGVGAAAIEGPGAPVESATSAVLPEGGTLLALKIDHAKFARGRLARPDVEGDYSRFTMLGIGHGFTPWFSGYLFVPHNVKADESGGFRTRGWADVSVLGQIGFRHDGKAFSLVPKNESLDEMEDWHFTVFGGGTLPTGRPNTRLPDGSIDPGMSTGFGNPSYTLGLTATKMITPKLTFNAEASTLWFQEYRYATDYTTGLRSTTRFGRETRLNGALTWRAHTDAERKLRTDLVLEMQYLKLGRDVTDGVGEQATGGRMLYAVPGVRVYWDKFSLAVGVKKAIWKNLNEQRMQQGAEGLEKYRLLFTASMLF
ncbi:MAG: transporter [Betaproteobacteria bacterium]|nr:transporter [Betaproteobacteria bacterium]